jgi:hypothetical protein
VLGSRTDGALEEETSWPNGMWTLLITCALCGLGSAVSGCSAVAALAETHRAERALVSTTGLSQTPATVYALTLSRAYLDKAREQSSEAQYGSAIAYAKAATRAAEDAQRSQIQRMYPVKVEAPGSKQNVEVHDSARGPNKVEGAR